MNQSTNYNFNLPEGADLVNLLTQLIPNWASLDSILKGVENQAFTNCTEVTSLGVHAISRTNADGKILKWIATANFTAGDTFTVDGNVVSASTPSGGTLATNAYVTGAVIIAALNSDESAMTVFVTGSNVAADSERLGGELPSYYAKNSDMETAKQAITDLDNLMGTTSISAIGDGTATGAISAINNDLTNSVSVTATNNETASSVFNRLYALIDESKITPRACLILGSNRIKVERFDTGVSIRCSQSWVDTAVHNVSALLKSSGSQYLSANNNTITDVSSTTLSGTITFRY